ncbi:replication-relaxation family protein [Streptomyces sp. NPDC051704]|uniref:replication-relaxation family protein n=1 Tax=Streptomyces sp. NPDC051704 TaxID=3365671 RepID=UPI0037A2C4DA
MPLLDTIPAGAVPRAPQLPFGPSALEADRFGLLEDAGNCPGRAQPVRVILIRVLTDTILPYTDTVLRGRKECLTDWQVEVNHAIKETGLSFNTDAVLAVPTKTSEVRLFALDNGSMSRPCLAKEVWDCERYAGHRVWQGACGTIGRTYPFWQRHRYTRSKTFLGLHVVVAGMAEHLLDNRLQALTAAVQGITFEVWANTLPDFSAASSGARSASTTRTGAASATPEAVGR